MIRIRRLNCCAAVCVVLCLAFAGQLAAYAVDESESLAPLVQILGQTEDTTVQASLLRGMLGGLAGRRNVRPPAGWDKLSAKLRASKDPAVRDLTEQLAQIFGDRGAAERALATLRDSSAELPARRTALKSLLAQQNEQVMALLKPLLDDPALRLDAIRAYAVLEYQPAPEILLKRYPNWDADVQRAVVETLATRKSCAQALLAAMQKRVVSRDDIPAYVARSLSGILGDSFNKIYGDVRELTKDKHERIAGYKRLLTDAALARADASRGRALYHKSCAACHVLYDDGGKIGPELTGSNRANLDYILLNLVDPSYDVPDAYKMVNIETASGRLLSGIIAEEDDQRVVLKTADQPTVIIGKSDIEDRSVSPLSLMPDGQLLKMNDQEVLDLIKYLQTEQQVELPK